MLRIVWRILRWPLLVLAIAAAGWLGWTAKLRADFDGRLDGLRMAGDPVDLEHLRRPAVPEDKNAAPLLARAAEQIGELPVAFDEDPEFLEPEQIAAVTRWLDEHKATIALLHEAAARPACRYDLRWEDGLDMVVKPIQWTQTFTRVLEEHAEREAKEGRPEEALRSLMTMMRLGDFMPRSLVICYLVRVTVHGVALETLKKAAGGPGFSAALVRSKLDPVLAAAEDPQAPLHALRGERALGLSCVRPWIRGESPRRILAQASSAGDEGVEDAPVTDWFWSSWLTRPFACKDGIFLLDSMKKGLELFRAEDWPGLERLAQEDKRGFPYLFSSLYVVLPHRVGRERRVHLAKLRVARAGLALLAYRELHDHFPARLADAAKLPPDPYTGAPLRVELRRDGTARIEASRPVKYEELRNEYEVAWDLK